MCGIAGAFNTHLAADTLTTRLNAMRAAMVHRGPDHGKTQLYPDCNGGLASQRLSLVDLPGGNQPVESSSKRFVVVFSGEIYNHIELRKKLQSRGCVFRSTCDTEVVANLFQEYGVTGLIQLHGMFAIAALDRQQKTLVLARDRSGMRSLYWSKIGTGLVFGSEIKAVLGSGLVDRKPDLSALKSYLSLAYIPAPRTGISNLNKLAAGSYLEFSLVSPPNASKGDATPRTFWQPTFSTKPCQSARLAAEELDELLRRATASHLAADVPVGCYISGGLDSSLIASIAAKQKDQALTSFSIVFPNDSGADESQYSRSVAKHIGSDHHEIEFRIEDMLPRIESVVRAIEEPNCRGPHVLGYLLAEGASRKVKAVLSGDGADELFAGYHWYRSRVYDMGERLNGFFPRRIARQLAKKTGGSIENFMKALSWQGEFEKNLGWLQRVQKMPANTFFSKEFQDQPADYSSFLPPIDVRNSCSDLLQRRLAMEFHGRFTEGTLMPKDKLSMAHSLEERLPFLDADVVDFALSLPSKLKMQAGQEKIVLNMLDGRLPALVKNRKKFGLRYTDSGPVARQVIPGAVERIFASKLPLFDRAVLEKRLPTADFPTIWSLLMLSVWWDEFIG